MGKGLSLKELEGEKVCFIIALFITKVAGEPGSFTLIIGDLKASLKLLLIINLNSVQVKLSLVSLSIRFHYI